MITLRLSTSCWGPQWSWGEEGRPSRAGETVLALVVAPRVKWLTQNKKGRPGASQNGDMAWSGACLYLRAPVFPSLECKLGISGRSGQGMCEITGQRSRPQGKV